MQIVLQFSKKATVFQLFRTVIFTKTLFTHSLYFSQPFFRLKIMQLTHLRVKTSLLPKSVQKNIKFGLVL